MLVAWAGCGGQAAWAAVLLFLQEFRPSPWHPGGYTCAIIVFRQCPPSIEEAAKIKSPNLFQVENNILSQDVKGLCLSIRFVSSQVIVMSW